MLILTAGLVLFLGIHALPMVPALRDGLRDRLGPNPYRGLYSLIALVGLVLIVWGKGQAAFDPLWTPPTWSRGLAHAVMPFAFVLVVAANFRGRIRRALGHPMVIGTLLWATAHLLANGDRASVLLFGAFAAWALVDWISAMVRGGVKPAVGPLWHDIAAVVLGLGAYAAVMHFHGSLFGVAIVG